MVTNADLGPIWERLLPDLLLLGHWESPKFPGSAGDPPQDWMGLSVTSCLPFRDDGHFAFG